MPSQNYPPHKWQQSKSPIEELYAGLFENVTDMIFTCDVAGNLTSLNRVGEQISGYTREEVLRKNLLEIVAPEYCEPAACWLERAVKGETPSFGQWGIVAKDGRRILLEVSSQLIYQDGEPVVVQGIARDITERKGAEEALRESEKRYRLLAENVTDVIWITDLDLRYTYVSPSVNRLRGVTVEEAMAERLEQTLTPRSLEVAQATLAEELSKERIPQEDPRRSRTLELEQICKDGSAIWTEVRATFLRDSEGRPSGLLGITRDISERKQAEQERMHLEEELRQAQKMEAVGRLAGGIAHDFNNIVMVINGYAQLVLRKLSPRHPLRQSINEIRRAGERAARLTGQLLAFSRRQILVPEILNLNSIVAGAEEMLRRVIGEDVELVIRQGHKLAKVLADPGQMTQVLVNVVLNARDAMPRGGRLTIETANVDLREGEIGELPGAAPGPYVMLAVSDTGVGMSKEVMDHMFEPFFTTKEPRRGTGLGLATVYGIVKQSGGYVWAHSEPGQGSTFRVYLPRAQVSPGKPAARPTKGGLTKGRETILVVEDELPVRQVIAQALRSCGYKVLEAGSGGQAMHCLSQYGGPLHLVLTDLVMPRMSGREVGDNLRTLYPEVKVLFMSGYTDEALLGHGISDAPASFLQKPFTVEALTQMVRNVLKQTSAQNT
jgi:two-component system cell cycle sensor histidine kinase/response regulator CckA